jgi:hypothetical protein
MSQITPHLKLLEDALSEETRKERRNLLIANAVGLAIVKAGLIPKQVSAMGVVSDVNEKGLLIVLASVTIYFLIAFIVYAYSDFIKYVYAWGHGMSSRMDEFNASHKDYRFQEIEEGQRLLFPTYIPRTPELEEFLRLQAEIKNLVASFNSGEIEKLAREFAVTTHRLKLYEYGIDKKMPEGKGAGLSATSKDLKRMLSALGAQKVIELQERESDLNVRHAASMNRALKKLYQDTGLDWNMAGKFATAAGLKFVVDFLIPIGTGVYAIVSMLRGR